MPRAIPVLQSQTSITVIVPVLNAISYLPQTAPSIVKAAGTSGRVELLYIDNGSTDESTQYLESLGPTNLKVHERLDCSIAGVRNFGAALARGEFLSFLDADCLVDENYFEEAMRAIASTGAAATGSEVEIPSNPHWIEATWKDLHFIRREGDVHYLNSGNFFISRDAFDRVGGFREDLLTGEDAEIGQRLLRTGYRIHRSPKVKAVHLGNPKSLSQFYRRMVWHGLGMFGTVSWGQIDKPTAMTGLHLAACIMGIAVLVTGPYRLALRVFVAIVLQLVAPVATVAYRSLQTGTIPRFAAGTALYWLYYSARIHALALILIGKDVAYKK